MVKAKRNWRIELLRFIATIGICVFHFEWIYIGKPIFFQHFYLFVEFFFVLSGFFLARNIDNKANDKYYGSLRYTFDQAKKLYPVYLIGFCVCFVSYCIVNHVKDLKSIISLLWSSKWELVYLHLSGLNYGEPVINGVTAYIPALLASSLILHYLLSNHNKLTISLIVPLAPIAIYSHIIFRYGNLSQWDGYENWYCVGLLRGVAGMSCGVLAWYIVHMLSNNEKHKLAISGAGILLSISLIMALVAFREQISYFDEAVYPYVFALLIGSTFLREQKYNDTIVAIFFLFLGRISFPIFVTHFGICKLLKYYMPEVAYHMMLPLYLVLVLALAIIIQLLIMLAKKRSKE